MSTDESELDHAWRTIPRPDPVTDPTPATPQDVARWHRQDVLDVWAGIGAIIATSMFIVTGLLVILLYFDLI